MAKRFTATEIWDEDWFLEMPIEYKLFWHYMLSTCDHAGLFKVNLRSFCGLNEVKISSDKALSYFNAGKQRIRIINISLWFIEDFFVFQYGEHLNNGNRMHQSVKNLLEKNNIDLTSIRGLKEVNGTLKDKDKDIEKDISLKEGVVGETIHHINGTVVYDAEQEVLKNQIEFERICQLLPGGSDGKISLRQYHLHLLEKNRYPMGRKAIFGGFEKWVRNEIKFSQNGTNRKASSDNSGKLGTSEARVKGLEKW